MNEAELFLAMNFPEHYFGSTIEKDGNFSMIPMADFFDGKEALQVALERYNNHLKIKNGLCERVTEGEDVVIKPYSDLKLSNGMIFNKEEN